MDTNNYLRLGFTESTLLFYYYCQVNNINNIHTGSHNSLINWLYSTSGFYDKNIEGSYFNFNAEIIKKSNVYNKYFEKLLDMIKNKNNNIKLYFNFHIHNMDDKLKMELKHFLQSKI